MTEKEIIEKNKRFNQFIRKAQREGATSENVKLLEDLMDDDIKALRDELGISKRAFLRHLIFMSIYDPVTAYLTSNDEPMYLDVYEERPSEA